MATDDRGDVIELARRAAFAGGEVAMDYYRTDLDIREKDGKIDPVTRADLDAQDRIVEVIRDAGFDEPIVAEENDAAKRLPEDGRAWVIDPIDGTNNFARGTWTWGVCVGVVEEGEPLGGATYMPVVGDTYVAGPSEATLNGESISPSDRTDPEELLIAPIFGLKGKDRPNYRRVTDAILERFGDLRGMGSAQATLATVAAGGTAAAVSTVPLDPWDTLVGASLVREAGGRVTTLDGDRWHPTADSLIASNGSAHELVLDAIRDAVEWN